MTIKLATIIPSFSPAVCRVVWDYEAGEEAELVRRERELDESEKSPELKARWQLEYDRNLRIFWRCILHSHNYSDGLNNFSQHLSKALTQHPDWLSASDRALCAMGSRNPNTIPETGETTAAIRRILGNAHLKEGLFTLPLHHFYYVASHEQTHPTLLVQEVSCFPNIREVIFYNERSLVGPIDLRPLSNLDTVDIRQSNLTPEDLLLSHSVNAYTTQHTDGETIGPSCLQSWANWIVSACQRFIAWACSWFT